MKRSSRRNFIGSLAGLTAGTALAGAQEKRPEFTGPLTTEKLPKELEVTKPNDLNIIVIIADTFRWDYLGASGNKNIKTPNFCQESLRVSFVNALSGVCILPCVLYIMI